MLVRRFPLVKEERSPSFMERALKETAWACVIMTHKDTRDHFP